MIDWGTGFEANSDDPGFNTRSRWILVRPWFNSSTANEHSLFYHPPVRILNLLLSLIELFGYLEIIFFTFHRQQKSILSRIFPRSSFSGKRQRNKPLRPLILQPDIASSFVRLDCLLQASIRGGQEFGADLQKPLKILTWPCWSSSLFVSFTLSNDTTCRIQSSPSAGESGWMYTRPGIGESAFPATTHLELWYAYLKRKEDHSISKTLRILNFLADICQESHALKSQMIFGDP